MDQRRSILAVLAFIAGIAAIWIFLAYVLSYIERGEGQEEPRNEVGELVPFILSHTREGEVHSYSGSLDLPTPCHALKSSISVVGGVARKATIGLEVQEPSEGTICAQVIDEQEFAVSVTSAVVPDVSLHVNGAAVPISIVEK